MQISLKKLARWGAAVVLGLTPVMVVNAAPVQLGQPLPAVILPATVDLMVVYGDGANNYYSGQVETAMRSWVAQINGIYQNSQIHVQLRLVGVMQHNLAKPNLPQEMGNFLGDTKATDLISLSLDQAVLQRREQLGADYVVALSTKPGSCDVSRHGVGKDLAFNVIDPACGAQAMAHSLGHTMGLAHSRAEYDTIAELLESSDSTLPHMTLDDWLHLFYGVRYPYGKGHGVDGVFATIMTDPSKYHTSWVPKFSNPNISCNGLPCGVADQADAARAINNVRNEIAAFMPTKVAGGTATGTPANGIYSIKAKHSGKCMDVSGASKSYFAPVIQWSCHSGDNQRWIFTSLGDGNYRIQAKHSKQCLAVSLVAQESKPLQQWPCMKLPNELWKVEYLADGSYRLTSRDSNKAATVPGISQQNGTQLAERNWWNGGNQHFILERIQ